MDSAIWSGVIVAVVGGGVLAVVKWGVPRLGRAIAHEIGDVISHRWKQDIAVELQPIVVEIAAIRREVTGNGGNTNTTGDRLVRIERKLYG